MSRHFGRDEILSDWESLKDDESFGFQREEILLRAVLGIDVALCKVILACDANPNYRGRHQVDGMLHLLAHEYRVARSTKGSEILKIAELLLQAGADPNDVGANNLAPINWCSTEGRPFADLLVRYGADPAGREFV